jgi:hypothetical protein
MWIRSARWDCFWILSGFPLGLALNLVFLLGHIPGPVLIIWFVVLLDMGHNLSPVALAWSHGGFRQMMLRNKGKYVVLPLVFLAIATAIGFAAQAWFPEFSPFVNAGLDASAFRDVYDAIRSPFAWMLLIYLIWNLYHFGMQNFGIMTIYRQRSAIAYGPEQRRIDMIFCLAVQVAVTLSLFVMLLENPWRYMARLAYEFLSIAAVIMLLREAAVSGRYRTPRIAFALSHTLSLTLWPGLWVIAINGFNHWLTAIGLSSHVYGVHKSRSPVVFAGIVTGAGILLFAVLFFSFKNGIHSWNLRDIIILLLPATGFRLGLGFVHFLYDRWVWKFSDPQVRATIGADLFRAPQPADMAAPLAARKRSVPLAEAAGD